jgi:hypothetical protein
MIPAHDQPPYPATSLKKMSLGSPQHPHWGCPASYIRQALSPYHKTGPARAGAKSNRIAQCNRAQDEVGTIKRTGTNRGLHGLLPGACYPPGQAHECRCRWLRSLRSQGLIVTTKERVGQQVKARRGARRRGQGIFLDLLHASQRTGTQGQRPRGPKELSPGRQKL